MPGASAELLEAHRVVADQIDGMIELAADRALHDLEAPRVSKWTVGKQLEHLLLSDQTILGSLDRLIDGSEGPAPGGPTLLGRVVLATGFVPRGLGKAPRATRPAERDAEEIEAGLRQLAGRLSELGAQLPLLEEAGWRTRHPYFGALDIAQWLRFMAVHHHHHLKIVRDIRKAARA